MEPAADYLDLAHDRRLAFRRSPGSSPTVVFLSGLRSDMGGIKATWLEAHCRSRGQGFLRLDYRGHGLSSGRFVDGTIGTWLDDALAIIDHATEGPLVLVGSSMGGWLMLLAALARPKRVSGLVGIAAAPDFTEELVLPALSPEQRRAIEVDGSLQLPSAYGEPLVVTRALLEDGRRHLVLGDVVPIECPVHLLHGQMDTDVPWAMSLRLAARLASRAITVEPVKDGDHRLSRDADLRRIGAAVDRVTLQATTGLPS